MIEPIEIKLQIRFYWGEENRESENSGFPAGLVAHTLDVVNDSLYHSEQHTLEEIASAIELPPVNLDALRHRLSLHRDSALVIKEASSGSLVIEGVIGPLCLWVIGETLAEPFKEAFKASQTHKKLTEILKIDVAVKAKGLAESIKQGLSKIKETVKVDVIKGKEDVTISVEIIQGKETVKLPSHGALLAKLFILVPGDMVLIPKGRFLYGDKKEEKEIDYDYYIDVFPVTNGQFREFVDAGGYTDKEILDTYWSKEGREWRQNNSITSPIYWDEPKWNQSDHPVVGVSYYEAEAYAKWAGKRLPTEQEWEKAARGTDGREYPWGDEFDKEKCNTSESGIRGTTRVDRYPNGVSPYGCYDMAGNVWEWTDSWYDEGRDLKVLRGGSWVSFQGYARCAARSRSGPDDGYSNIGFRCARTLTL